MSKPTRREPQLPHLPPHMHRVLDLFNRALWQALLIAQPDVDAALQRDRTGGPGQGPIRAISAQLFSMTAWLSWTRKSK